MAIDFISESQTVVPTKEVASSTPTKGVDFQVDFQPETVQPMLKPKTLEAKPKTLFGDAIIPALMEALTRSEPSVAEPGFAGAAKDVSLGIPEAIAGLTSGLGSFVGGQVASVPTAITAMLPQGKGDKFDVTRGLAEGQKVAEKISTAGTYHPTTDTGKLLMKPIDLVFGTLLGSVENTVRQLADPITPKEEVDKRVQASQYVTNSLLLGLPLLKGKLEKGKPLTVEDFKEAEKAIPAETPPDVASTALDALRNFNIKEAVSSNVKTKFEGNQSIAEGLMTEALKREGHAKGALNRVAKIVSDLEDDVSGVDFKGMKGVGPKSKALIEQLIKDRDAVLTPEIPTLVEAEPTVPEKLSEAVGKPTQVKTLEQMGVTEPSAQVDHIVRDAVSQKLDLANGLDKRGKVEAADKVRQEGFDNAKKLVTADGPVTEALIQKVVNEKVAKPFPEIPKVEEPRIISEFDNTILAKGEGYEIRDKRRFDSIDSAQKVAEHKGLDHEVIKIGDKYAVGKFTETAIPEYASMETLKADLEVMSEIPYAKAKIEAEQPEGSEFWVARVGDKYYRTVVKDPNAPVRPNVDFISEEVKGVEVEIEPTPEVLKAEEVQLKKDLKALVKESKKVDAPKETIRPEIADAFKKYKERYVDKINVAKEVPVTPKDLPVIDSNFATFKSEAEGLTYKEATGKKGELIQDPLSKEWFIEPELEGFEDLNWEDGMESLTSHHRDRLSDETLDYGEMSEDGTRDLFSIFSNERGAVDVTPLRIAVDKMEQVVEASKKAGKSIDEFLDMIGMSPEAISQFKTALAQMPKDKETLKSLDPITERILNPTEPIAYQTVKMNKMGEVKSVMPPITKALSSKILNATRHNIWGDLNTKIDPISGREIANISTSNIQRYLQATETRINAFRRFGIPEIYRDWRELKTKKELEYNSLGEEIKLKRDSLTKKEREDLAIAAYADMKGGEEAFAAMGIKPEDIPIMNAKQMEVFNWMTKTTSKMLDRVNYVRAHTGQKPIPRLLDKNGKENYLPLMRQMNVLREMGVLEGITTTDARRISSISSDYHGIFNPHAKTRKVSDIPIELDVFKAMESYLNYTLEEIYIGPLAAQVKELATVPLPKPEGKGSIILKNHNPGLSQLLLKWSDEIMGIDRTSSIMAIENPFIRSVAQQLSKNIVVGIIGGNLQTFLKQPTALIGVYANLGLPASLYGAGRYMIEKPFKGSKSEAQTLSNSLHIRKAELIWSDFVEQMKLGTLKGGKAIATKVAFAPMDLIDSVVAEIGWNAGFHYAKGKLKLGEKDAIAYADDLVERTQGMGTRGAVSPIQASIATKWLTLLQTFGIADFNYILQDIAGVKNPDITKPQQVSRAFRYIIGAMVIGEMFKAAGLNSPFPTPVDAFVESRDEGKGIPSATFSALLEFTEKLPVWGGSAKYGSSLGGVIGEFAQDVPEAAKAVNDLMDWDSMTKRQKLNASMLIAKSIGYAWGIPMTNQILKGVKTASRGGDPYQIILGIYIDERKKGGAANFKLDSPSLKLPKGL